MTAPHSSQTSLVSPTPGCRETSPSSLNSTDTTERNASMLRPRPAPSHRWSSWLPVLTPGGSGRRRRRPTKARPQLVGYDLDGGAGAAVLSGPGPLLEPTHDHDPAALRERLGRALGP